MSKTHLEPRKAPRRRRRCPSCEEPALVPILYGPLPQSLFVDQDRGDLLWGGMFHHSESPRWKCLACLQTFPDDAV